MTKVPEIRYAIFNGRIGEIVINVFEGVTIRFSDGSRKAVIASAPGLILDPTEAQIQAAGGRPTIYR